MSQPDETFIRNKVQGLVGMHAKLKKATADLKADRTKYKEMKEWVGNFMQKAELEVIEVQNGGSELEVVSRKRKPSTSITRKFLMEKMAEYIQQNGGDIDVAGCLDWVFRAKPPPKKDYSISIRKAKKQKKTKKLAEVELPPEEEEEILLEEPAEETVELSTM